MRLLTLWRYLEILNIENRFLWNNFSKVSLHTISVRFNGSCKLWFLIYAHTSFRTILGLDVEVPINADNSLDNCIELKNAHSRSENESQITNMIHIMFVYSSWHVIRLANLPFAFLLKVVFLSSIISKSSSPRTKFLRKACIDVFKRVLCWSRLRLSFTSRKACIFLTDILLMSGMFVM